MTALPCLYLLILGSGQGTPCPQRAGHYSDETLIVNQYLQINPGNSALPGIVACLNETGGWKTAFLPGKMPELQISINPAKRSCRRLRGGHRLPQPVDSRNIFDHRGKARFNDLAPESDLISRLR